MEGPAFGTQYPRAQRVERPDERFFLSHSQRGPNPIFHFSGRFVREGERANIFRRHALLDKPDEPAGQGPRLSRAGTRQNKKRFLRSKDGGFLLWVQFR